jgi:hypothetical protein
MVQVFGNRILGGVGAPGGGMSEAFGAGANTALGQRGARQTMAIRDQEMAWRGEDREEAKRRRQAAEAAALAARARQAAIFDAGTRGAGDRFFQLGAPTAGAATAPTGRSTLPRSMGVPEGATAPAPGGVLPRSGAGLSLGAPVAGGAGTTGLSGGDGTDVLGGPGVRPEQAAGLRAQAAELRGQRPAALSARPGARLPPESLPPAGLRERLFGESRRTSADIPKLQQERQSVVDDIKELTAAGRGGAQLTRLNEELAYIDQLIEAAKMTPPRAPVRGATAVEGPEATGTFLTEAPTATDLDEITVGPAPAPQANLGFGTSAPATSAPIGGPLSFGPALGAQGYDAAQAFLDDINMQPPGQLSLTDVMQQYAGPMADPIQATRLEQNRAMWAAVAQDAYARRDPEAYMASLAKVAEQEDLILLHQLMRGITEATQFNSPQRLSQVASMLNGIDMFIAPKSGGLADIYVDGQLVAPDRNLAGIIDQLRSGLDEGYRAKQAELSDLSAKERIKTDESIRLERSKAETEATVRAQGLDPDAVTLQTDPNSGDIIVYDKGSDRLRGVITTTDPTNPGQPLLVPRYTKYN